MKMYRQGDVLIVAVVELPEGLRPVPRDNGRAILAYGEATGHAHAVLEDVELLAADIAEMEETFLRVEKECSVVHDEHDTIALPAGDYLVRRQREYSPEEIRTVAD